MFQRKFLSRAFQFALVLLLVFGMLAPTNRVAHADPIRISNPALPATFAWPSWWAANDDCNSAYYNANDGLEDNETNNAYVQTTWRGIQSCGPKPGSTGRVDEQMPNYPVTTPPTYNTTENMFQCTEVAKRYLRVAYNINTLVANGGNLADVYGHDSSTATKLQYFANDGSQPVYPQEGDVISFESSDTNGHVAIVTALYVDTPGNGYITLMDQNGSDGTFTLDIADYVVGDESTLNYHPTDWIHPLVGIENSPSVSYPTEIGGIVSEHNHAWFAGQEIPSYRQPVVWNWNGSSWVRYALQAPGGSTTHHWLHDITSDANGNLWAVGEYSSYYLGWQRYTLTYRWDGTSWTRKTSQNYSLTSQNYLNAVTDDGNGAIYAAGYSVASGVTYPLLLKWNQATSTFEKQTISVSPAGQITDIAFSSPTSGWAVGPIGSLNTTSYVYHYDGSSWSAVALPNGARVQKIAVVSDSEIWGVDNYAYGGSSTLGRIIHYTTANGWQLATSSVTNAVYNNIDIDEANNIWVVGSHFVGSYQQPDFWRYTGPNQSDWQEITTKTYTYGGVLRDVSVSDGFIWSAGDRPLTSTPGDWRYPFVLVK